MAVYALGELVPDIDETAYVHPDAVVIGQVTIGPGATIWPGAVLRGDYGRITVGSRTSIQDGTIIHATQVTPTIIGADCVVGHNAHLEGCIISDHALVGSGSVVLHNAQVHSHALVGANAVVPDNMVVPTGCMALGVPAKLREHAVREGQFSAAVAMYVKNGERYRNELRRLD